jgi:hypothetical protein
MADDDTPGTLALEPLAYHRSVVAQLREHEPEIWQWAASHQTREEHTRETRTLLLRETYRLDPTAHPEVHVDCASVLSLLGLEASVTLYQAADGAMNAALCFIPGEIHLIFHGPVLEKLSRSERLALIGHELAHYRLWSIDNGQYHIADQILDHAMAYSQAASSHGETARVYRLNTELFADRGAAVAARDQHAAIATLVKTMTGLASVDTAAYLRQAAELEGAGTSRGETHPEVFMRAQAVDKWWRRENELDQWIDARIRGPLSLNSLDLLRQHELTALTRGFLTRLISNAAAGSESVTAQVRRFFPDWNGPEQSVDMGSLARDRVDNTVHEYLTALCFDVATSDPDLRDSVLAAGAHLIRGLGGADAYRAALTRDLGLTRQGASKLMATHETTPE